MNRVAILGAGAWGTALAVHLARTPSAPELRLWARDAAQARAITAARENLRYLPGVPLSGAIAIGAPATTVRQDPKSSLASTLARPE